MADIYGIKRLRTINDWIEVVTRRHYKAGHSAYELAHRFLDTGKFFPEPIASLLQDSEHCLLRDLEIKQLYCEFPVWLDTLSSPSKNDLMVFCEGPNNRKVTIAIEGKALETFSSPVATWVRAADKPTPQRQRKLFYSPSEPVTRKVRRLEFLNQVLSIYIGLDSPVMYQLLHRLASAILIARQTSAEATVMLVHAFADSKRNFEDFQFFCSLLGFPSVRKNTTIGPYYTAYEPKTPVYLIYVQDRRQADLPWSPLFKNSPSSEAA